MESPLDVNLKYIINNSLQKAVSYQAYRNLVKDLVNKTSTTGHEKTEDLINYTRLNYRRMKRWDKTIKIEEAIKEKVLKAKVNQTWIVLTESWCGDAAHVMPVINKITEVNENITFKVLLRDENATLMNLFLTNGSKSIPKLIIIDNNTNVLNTYGPRPSIATRMVNDYKAKHGTLTPEFKENLQHWYNKDKGQNVIEDLVKLIL